MAESSFDQKLDQLMGQDLSIGTEAFREDLLNRCLAIMGADSSGIELDDGELDLLSAAGDVFLNKLPDLE